MIYTALILLLLAAVACLGLNRILPTRMLGLLAAVAALVSTVVLVAGHVLDIFPEPTILVWATMDASTIRLAPHLEGGGLLLASSLLMGGTLLFFTLACALVPTVRGFGGIFAWSLLALAAALMGLANQGMIVALSWAITVLCMYATVRAAGMPIHSEYMPYGLAFGMFASLLLVAGQLLTESALSAEMRPGMLAVSAVVVTCLMLAGGAPFQQRFDEAVAVPAALGSLVYGVICPLLGVGTLLTFVDTLRLSLPGNLLPPTWQMLLIALGLLSLIAGTAGALRQHSLRAIIAWQVSAQVGLVVLSVGIGTPLATLAAPALLVNLVLTTICASVAVAIYERALGSDDYTQIQPGVDLRLPGLLWIVAAASALGVPGFWGFWGRRWLLEAAEAEMAWIIAPVLASTLLLALSYLAPLACFWWHDTRAEQRTFHTLRTGVRPFLLVTLLVPLPLLGLGLAPQVIEPIFTLDTALVRATGSPPFAAVELPINFREQLIGLVVVVIGALLLGVVPRSASTRHIPPDEDMTPVVLAPDALSERLLWLSGLSRPAALFGALWNGLLLVGDWIYTAISVFEGRFYLASVLLAVISLILLLAQG